MKNSVAILTASAVGGGVRAGGGGPFCASATKSNSTAPSLTIWPLCSGLPVAGSILMRVPLVEPRSVTVTIAPFMVTSACEPDTDASSSLKSLAKPRPT
jgi:hypothetical protein